MSGWLLSACSNAPTHEEQAANTLRAQRLLASSLVIDMHSHVGGTSKERTIHDFETIQRGGLTAVCLSLVADKPVTKVINGRIVAVRQPAPGELYTHMLERLNFADEVIRKHKLRYIFEPQDLLKSKQDGVPGLIVSTEGCDFLENKLERLHLLHERGVRHLQLVHYRSDNDIGDIQTEAALYNGLTPFGRDVVKQSNELGLLVDVAHATFDTVKQVAATSTTPLILSHTSYTPVPGRFSRRIDKSHAKLVAETGGVVGVWANGSNFSSYTEFARSLLTLAELIGIKHVGIGTDLHGVLHAMLPSYTDFPELVVALLKYFNEEELGMILGGNYLRVFKSVNQAKRI